jgi:hypothetical protein
LSSIASEEEILTIQLLDDRALIPSMAKELSVFDIQSGYGTHPLMVSLPELEAENFNDKLEGTKKKSMRTISVNILIRDVMVTQLGLGILSLVIVKGLRHVKGYW